MNEENIEHLDQQIVRELNALARVNQEAEAVVSNEIGAALVPVTQSPEMARQQLARQRGEMTKLSQRIQEQTKKVAALQRRKAEAMERRMKRELQAMDKMLAPLQEKLAQLEEVVWMVNLYLGRDEQIVRIRDGKPAPADVPVTVRQLVLAMDEECAVASEHGGIDSLNHELFDEWLQADPAHVEQVIPEQKGVVALVPRYVENSKRYEDAGTYQAAREGNKQTYFLIRNGGKLWRTWTEFDAGRSLIPRAEQFTQYFKNSWREFDADGNPITPEYVQPGTAEWAKAEKAAKAEERHFMRVGLILEGLLHRTTVFHPLPEDGVGISFTDSRSHEAGRVRFVADAERVLGSGELEPFDKWLANLSGQLRKGMRIVGNFRGQGFQRANKEEEDSYTHRKRQHRISPDTAETPTTGAIYKIEDRKPNGDLIFRYKRTQETYIGDSWGYGGEYRVPKTRASCIIRPGDNFVIPLDLVDVRTMERYLESRLERHTYTTMFPILKAAIRAKKAEEAVEAPYREMLVGVLMRETGQSEDTVREVLPELIQWYKLGNRIHRPLFLDDSDNSATTEMLEAAGASWDDVELVLTEPSTKQGAHKSIKLIGDEYKRRLSDRTAKVHEETVAGLRDLHRDALLVARMRNGRYIVLTPEDERNVFVRERQYTAGGALREDKRWVLPGTRVSRWTVLFESERWVEWDLTATLQDHLTGPEVEEFVELARAKWAHQIKDDKDECIMGRSPSAVVKVMHQGAVHEVEVWSLGREPRYGSHSHGEDKEENSGEPGFLTGLEGPAEPSFYKRDYRWRRKGEKIQVYCYNHGRNSWSGAKMDEKDERFGPWHPEGSSYAKNNVVVWDDEGKSLDKFFELKATRKVFTDQRARYEERVKIAERSLERQWLQPQYDAIFQRFLEDYHDPDLWHSQPDKVELPLFPYGWRSRQRNSYSFDAHKNNPAHLRALRALIERDVMPWGMTVRETVELAQNDDRFNYIWYQIETHEEHKNYSKSGGSYTSTYTKRPREQWTTSIPDEIADLTYLEDFELVEPWPPEPEPEDTCERCHEPKSECICAEIFCEGCGELEEDCICEDEDFDEFVEGTIEEGIAALPMGDQ